MWSGLDIFRRAWTLQKMSRGAGLSAQLMGVSKQIALERRPTGSESLKLYTVDKSRGAFQRMQQKVQFITTIIHQPDF